jgi:bacterioferritin (cytochrome b1)
MLLSREEMTFDFGGAKLDPSKDKKLLGWIFNQCLYGEVTGIQVGHWLYGAPDMAAARFLARQSVEEMQHVDNFLTILSILGVKPEKPHAALRFLATGMMGQNWAEHVMIEMAQGEGFVLMALYALIDILDQREIVAILERAVKQEERHVDFGEQRTIQVLRQDPGKRRRLLGLALVSALATEQLARAMHRLVGGEHPVMKQLSQFLQATLAASELRLERMGILDRPLRDIGWPERARLISAAYAGKVLETLSPFKWPRHRLTEVYVEDPYVRQFVGKAAEIIRPRGSSRIRVVD